MKKHIFILVLISLISCAPKQSKEEKALLDTAKEAQYELNIQFADKDKSPLDSIDFVKFRALEFFPIDLKFIVKATFEKNKNPIPFEMETSTDRKPVYQKYGTLSFDIAGKHYHLACFQSLDANDSEEEKQYVSMPFTDLTTGDESYGGGRYLDLKIPFDSEILIDFNQVYNPYCAYSHKWSCIIPPEENDLDVAIKAGVKAFH